MYRAVTRARPQDGSVSASVQAFVAALVGRPAFWVIFVTLLFALPMARAMTRPLPKAPAITGHIGEFALFDHRGGSVTDHDLRGKVWVVDFVAMHETKPSDDMSKTMARLRYRTRNLSHAVHFVTITTDPSHDDDTQREKYATRFHANTATWSFLGGSEPAVKTALGSFGITTEPHLSRPPSADREPNPDLAQFARRDRLVLVDQKGNIRGSYATDLSSLDSLVYDVGLLANDVQ